MVLTRQIYRADAKSKVLALLLGHDKEGSQDYLGGREWLAVWTLANNVSPTSDGGDIAANFHLQIEALSLAGA
jgi:hypothetical protein